MYKKINKQPFLRIFLWHARFVWTMFWFEPQVFEKKRWNFLAVTSNVCTFTRSSDARSKEGISILISHSLWLFIRQISSKWIDKKLKLSLLTGANNGLLFMVGLESKLAGADYARGPWKVKKVQTNSSLFRGSCTRLVITQYFY